MLLLHVGALGGKLAFDIMIGLLRYNCTILLAVYFATVEIETCTEGKTPTVYCLAHYTILYLFSMQITTAATPRSRALFPLILFFFLLSSEKGKQHNPRIKTISLLSTSEGLFCLPFFFLALLFGLHAYFFVWLILSLLIIIKKRRDTLQFVLGRLVRRCAFRGKCRGFL